MLLELLIELALELQKAELVLLQLLVSCHCDALVTRDSWLARGWMILLLLLLLMKAVSTVRYVVVCSDGTILICSRLAAIK